MKLEKINTRQTLSVDNLFSLYRSYIPILEIDDTVFQSEIISRYTARHFSMDKLKGNHICTTLCAISLTDLSGLFCFLRNDCTLIFKIHSSLNCFLKDLHWNSNCICKMYREQGQVCLISYMLFSYLERQRMYFSMCLLAYECLTIVTLYMAVYKHFRVCMWMCIFKTTQIFACCYRNIMLNAVLHY